LKLPKISLSQIFTILFILDLLLPTPEDAVPVIGWMDELLLLTLTALSFFMERRRAD
jgi:hypothetical protein